MKNLNLNEQEKQRGWHDFCSINHANQTEVQADTLSAFGRSAVSVTLEECPANNALKTRLSRANHALLPLSRCVNTLIRIGDYVVGGRARRGAGKEVVAMMRQKCMMWKYAAMVVLMLTLGVGEMWGGTKRVYIDVSFNTNYNNIWVHWWDNDSHSGDVSASLFNSGTWNYMYYADIDDRATGWLVRRKGTGGEWCNQQNDVTYSSANFYKVTDWNNSGEAKQLPGLVTGGYIYMDNTNSNWDNSTYPNRYMAIGNSTTKSYQLSQLSGTNLWAGTINNTWPDASYFSFYALTSGSWGDGGWGYSNISSNAPKYLQEFTGTYDLSSGGTYVMTPSGSTNGASFSFAYKDGGYNDLNKDQTLYVMLSTNGGDSYTDVSSSTWKGTIKATRTYVSGNCAATTKSGASAEALSSSARTKGAAITSNYQLDESSTATGYTFVGFNTSNSAPSPSNTTITINNISGENDIYAFFKANSYTISYEGNGSTTGSTANSTHYYGVAKALTSNGFAKEGYTFDGWNTQADGTGTSYTAGQSVSNLSSSQGATVTLYAQWKQVITLDDNGGTSDGHVTVYYKRNSVSNFSEAVKSGYTCKGYYTATSEGYKIFAASTGALSSYSTDISSYVNSDGKWIYNGTPSLYAQWTANSYTISFNADDASRVGTATNVQASVTVTYDAKNFSAATVAVPVLAGYTFGGYYTATNGGGEQIVDANGAWITSAKTGYLNALGNWIKAANTILYAKWTPQTYTVTLNHGAGTCATTSTTVTMGATYGEGTGLSGSLPTVTPPSGYRFGGWFTSANGGSQVTDETQVTTASDHTIYAHFVENTYVYFYNNLGWDKVYVTFNATWNDSRGAGNNGRVYEEMESIGNNIYRYLIPEFAFTDQWQNNIAFNNKLLGNEHTGNQESFNSGEVVFRGDFDSYATMFVPDKTNTRSLNGCTYYSNDSWADSKPTDYRFPYGYWRRYNGTESGYVLKGSWDGEQNDFYFRNINQDSETFTVTKALPANSSYTFMIYKHCNTDYKYNSWFTYSDNPSTKYITSTNCTDLLFNCTNAVKSNPTKTTIKTTAAGDYVLTLTCGTDGTLKLSVTYPLTADQDYRVLYSWNDGSAHTHASEIIHKEANTSKKISVFVHKAANVSSQSLTIQKCTAVSASGNPTWSDVNTITLPTENITANGVYNFVITQPASGDPTGAYSEPYTGEYYVRADATSGGWDFYKEKGNIMKYSAYSLTQTLSDKYSHYYCMFVNTTTQSVAFTVATEYSPSISDTLGTDDFCTGGSKYNQKLPATANVRFSWNEQTNAVHRSYLKNAEGAGNARFLVLHGSDDKVLNSNGSTIAAAGSGADDLKANELLFSDEGDWVYRLNLQAQPGAKASIMARYNGSEQYLTGGASSYETILGGSGTTKYTLHATYDFKTNRLIVAWTPPAKAITDALSDVDMLWVRHAQESAQEITFGTGGSLSNVEVVGAIEFKYNELIGRVGSWNSTTRPLLKYFISFPFDVEMSDIFGLTGSVYGREYVIQKYNGAERAKKGLFLADDGTFWQDMTLDETMHKGEGYCLIMDNDYLNDASASIWTNKSAGSSIFLYFPAKAKISSITNANENTEAEAHQSKSDRWWMDGGVKKENKNTDSHWNLIGSPLFANAYIGSTTNASGSTLSSYYTWNSDDNSWNSNDYDRSTAFNAMSCILVQWYGGITWTTSAPPASIAARRTAEKKNHTLKLELLRNEEAADWAFVAMRDGASSDFVLCEDMMKIKNSGKPNLYLYAGNYDVAYSQVPVETQTVPVGVIIRQNGTYTFSMPSNFDGTVTLIDKFAQTRTNLALEDYEVALERGTINDRFELEINIRNVPTAIDGVTDGSGSLKDGKAHKFIENGAMYILRDGQVFDARGNKVK